MRVFCAMKNVRFYQIHKYVQVDSKNGGGRRRQHINEYITYTEICRKEGVRLCLIIYSYSRYEYITNALEL